MNNLRSLDKIINEEVRITVKVELAPFSIKGDRIVRYGCTPEDVYRIIWTCVNPEWIKAQGENDETELCRDTIAIAEIRAVNFESFDQAIEYMDECTQETYDEACIAEMYYKRYPKRCESFKENYGICREIGIYDLHTLYISPKYRGKGIANIILLQLPELLNQLNLIPGIITAYINPFKRQDIELPNDSDCNPIDEAFDNDEMMEYSNLETEESKRMELTLRRIFEECGFSNIKDRYYVASTEYISKRAQSKKVLTKYVCRTWEHE